MSAYAITDQRAGLRLLGSGLPALDSEVARLAAFLNRANWDAPSRCAEWSVHDVVAHLASGELYNDACLRDDLARLGHWDDDEQYNVEHVRRRRGLSHAMVHAEWLRRSTSVHDRWRAMAQETLIPTGVGPYSLGMQVWHIASEYATHADDIEVPVPPCARASRLAWRVAFSRYALRERAVPVEVVEREGSFQVSGAGESLWLAPAEFVDAVSARFFAGDGGLRGLLPVLVTT